MNLKSGHVLSNEIACEHFVQVRESNKNMSTIIINHVPG